MLWNFLAIAAYEPSVEAAKSVPFVAAHLADWRRAEHFGFIAEIPRLGDAAAGAQMRRVEPDPDEVPEETGQLLAVGFGQGRLQD